jgi:hypothetical protein
VILAERSLSNSLNYCRVARREVGLTGHDCLAFHDGRRRWVGQRSNESLGDLENGVAKRQRDRDFIDSNLSSSESCGRVHNPFLVLVHSILCLTIF